MKLPSWFNKALYVIGTITVAAGSVAALPMAGIALPAAVVYWATHVAIIGAVVGTTAAKILPGHGDNAPAPKAP